MRVPAGAVTVAAAAAGLLSPAAAFAVVDPAAPVPPAAASALANAVAAGSNCAGILDAHWVPDPEFYSDPAHALWDAYQMQGTCSYYIRAMRYGTYQGCVDEVHEALHAADWRAPAGEEYLGTDPLHSSDPSAVMYGGGATVYAPCAAAVTPTTRRQAATDLIRDGLPSGTAKRWRITCTPGTTRCKATLYGSQPRRYSVDRDGNLLSI